VSFIPWAAFVVTLTNIPGLSPLPFIFASGYANRKAEGSKEGLQLSGTDRLLLCAGVNLLGVTKYRKEKLKFW
jgi:hypothetical protein